jgi:hypothetical protein
MYNTVCDYTGTENSHTVARRLKAIQGAGILGDGLHVNVWRACRFYVNGTQDQSLPIDQWTMYEDNTVYWREWTPSNYSGLNVNDVVQYKVGSWQGDKDAWTAVAATPGL